MNSLRIISRFLLVASCAAVFAVVPVQGQNISKIKDSARAAAASIQVTVDKGKSTVTYKGKTVWSGKSKEKVTAYARTVDKKEYAAAFDGSKVIWENIKGAAKQVR